MTILLSFPLQTLGNYCACCAERGEYSIRVKKPDDYEISELKRLQIKETTLYTDVSFPEHIKGISPLVEDDFNYNGTFAWQKTGWKFDFKNAQNAAGILNLTRPTTMVDYRTDTYNEGEPILYKELRFKFKVMSGTGIFKKGIVPATEYFLVFQGKGNQCMAAEQFTHWRLEVTGKKASYAFFGTLKTTD
jgi:hypothetical protein